MAEQPRSKVVRQGRIRRAAPLLGAAGRTAGEAVVASLRGRGRDEEFHRRAAERYAARLGRSKGVLMKAGQILSFVSFAPAMEGGGYQRVYQSALSRLQDDAEPMPSEVARETLAAELGAPVDEVFAEFEDRPLAAASIGQVHAARLPGGRRVAVKIQYPGVAEAIRADLDNTELLATFFQLARPVTPDLTRLDVRALAREVSARIGEEVDYLVEAANQAEFARIYRGHPFVRVPEVVPELCTRRVLTTDLADGMRWSRAVEADRELRDAWGEAIFRFTLGGLRRFGLFNGDPHPGNFLFNADGTVTFLDFGCVKRFSARQVAGIVAMVQATMDGDAERAAAAMIDTGFIEPNGDDLPSAEELLAWFQQLMRCQLAPQPFTYTREYASSVVQGVYSPYGEYAQVIRRISMRPDYLLLTRIDLGMTSVLGELGSTAHWEDIRREWDCGGPPATPYGERDQEFWAERGAGMLWTAGAS